MARKDPYCTCGRPQSDHEKGYGRAPTGCEKFTLRGRGGQLLVLGCVDPGSPPTAAPTYMVRCPRCKKTYETTSYLRDIVIRRSCVDCMKYRRGRSQGPSPKRPTDLPPAERYLHGSRARYVTGCRCGACREANNEYSRMRQKMVRAGQGNRLVDAKRVRAHLERLSAAGIGRRSVSDVARVGDTLLQEVYAGRKTQLREQTAARILGVTVAACVSDGHCIDAAPTLKLVDELLEQGYTRSALARMLGSKAKTPALQLKTDKIKARSAARIERLYRKVMG